MRKRIVLLMAGLLLLSGCGNSKPTTPANADTSTPQEVVESPKPTESVMQSEKNSVSVTESEPEEPKQEMPVPKVAGTESNKSNQVDVDLTQLSNTMLYSEVYNMVMTPEDYVGKTVKMNGQFAAYKGNPNNTDGPAYYFAVVIADATACCQQGLEFVWSGEHSYPEDYPEEGKEITVTGVFEPYQQNGYTYYHLNTDTIDY